MAKILITTVPFAENDQYPLSLLSQNNIKYMINPLGRKLSESELADLVGGFDVIVAGTEAITAKVLDRAPTLKMISRVGIGLDNVDLLAAESRNIAVSYTPDAPAPAVVELTIGLMYALLRHVHEANIQLHRGIWHRHFGKRLVNCKLGLIGVGRIGSGVVKKLRALGCKDILYNDINIQLEGDMAGTARIVEKEEIYSEADIISLHVPLTSQTKNLITSNEFAMMKSSSFLINTARGGIIDENDLYEALRSNRIAGAAVDVFEQEPYFGPLTQLDNCLLTSHMGSMAFDCRTQMEIEATQEAVRYLIEGRQEGAVPEAEYEVQREGL